MDLTENNDKIENANSVEANVVGCRANDNAVFAFIASYTLRTMRLKYDKWAKMMAIEDYRVCMQMNQQFR